MLTNTESEMFCNDQIYKIGGCFIMNDGWCVIIMFFNEHGYIYCV